MLRKGREEIMKTEIRCHSAIWKETTMSLNQTSTSTRKILDAMNLFTHFIDARLKTTPQMHLANNLKLQNARECLRFNRKRIEDLRVSFEREQREQIKDSHDVGATNVQTNSRDEISKQASNETISKSITIEKHERLSQTERMPSNITLPLLNDNILSENNARAQCVDAERRFLNCLAEYDRGMDVRHTLLSILNAEKNSLQEAQRSLEDRMSVQNVLYTSLREEQAIAATTLFIAKLERFQLDRAARIIQKAWRLRRERLSLKKKKKTRKK